MNILKNVKDENVKKDKAKEIYQMLKRLQKYRRFINKEADIFDKRVAQYNKLLLNPLTSKMFFNRFIR